MWCIESITPQYRERMYDVLDLYDEDYDPVFPVICFDEKSIQLIDDVREPIKPKPGKVEKLYYHYKRN